MDPIKPAREFETLFIPSPNLGTLGIFEEFLDRGFQVLTYLPHSAPKLRQKILEQYENKVIFLNVPPVEKILNESHLNQFQKKFRDKLTAELLRYKIAYCFLMTDQSGHDLHLLWPVLEKLEIPTNIKNIQTFANKSLFFESIKELPIRTPNLYKKVGAHQACDSDQFGNEVSFPCIVKPDLGSGGEGVAAFSTRETLSSFFKTNSSGSLNYHRSQLFGDYRVEEMIQGPVFSVSGIWTNKSIWCFVPYEIETTSLPFQAEKGFIYPCAEEHRYKKKLFEAAELLLREAEFPVGPFMFDFILDQEKEELVLIDFGARINSSGFEIYKTCSGTSTFQEKLIAALLLREIGGDKRELKFFEEPSFTYQGYVKRFFELPKGRVEQVQLPQNFISDLVEFDCPLSEGDLTKEPRIDCHLKENGYLRTLGQSRTSALDLWSSMRLKTSIEVSITNNVGLDF